MFCGTIAGGAERGVLGAGAADRCITQSGLFQIWAGWKWSWDQWPAAALQRDGNAGVSNFHVHYYHYPVESAGGAVDVACLDPGSTFDIAYVSELDPTWLDDELTFLLHLDRPCSAACPRRRPAPGTVCLNCRTAADRAVLVRRVSGSMYPMTGNVTAHVGGVQASLLAATRLMFKLHRQLIAWGRLVTGRCVSVFPADYGQRQYRFQQTQPTAQTTPAWPVTRQAGRPQAMNGAQNSRLVGRISGFAVEEKKLLSALINAAVLRSSPLLFWRTPALMTALRISLSPR